MADVDLRSYVDQRITDLEKRLDGQRNDLRDRLAGMNEFRETLRDQAGRMVTLTQYEELRRHVQDLRLQAAIAAGGVALLVSFFSRFVWPD